VTPNAQNVGESTLFNFTIDNTGTTVIYSVEIVPDVPSPSGSLLPIWLNLFRRLSLLGNISCPGAPAGSPYPVRRAAAT
jgi:hypothetical protein